MKILRILVRALAALLVVAALAWFFRSNPIGPISGRQLTGTEASYPADWSFSDAHPTIAVEVRPDDPHSVTTICFVHDGALYVPAQGGSNKEWTQIVLADSRVRLKVGDLIYAATATRITEFEPAVVMASAAKKYTEMADRMGEDIPEDIWLFRIGPRDG